MFFRKLATVSAVALLLGACTVTEGKQSAGEYVDDGRQGREERHRRQALSRLTP